MDYKQWRGAMVRAMRQEREYGLTPQRARRLPPARARLRATSTAQTIEVTP